MVIIAICQNGNVEVQIIDTHIKIEMNVILFFFVPFRGKDTYRRLHQVNPSRLVCASITEFIVIVVIIYRVHNRS